jgi:hypothetical protein
MEDAQKTDDQWEDIPFKSITLGLMDPKGTRISGNYKIGLVSVGSFEAIELIDEKGMAVTIPLDKLAFLSHAPI